MKVYTFFSQSHKIFIEPFIDSFPFEEEFDLEMKFLPQECQTGKYHSDGWNKTMKKKVEYILHAIDETPENSLFVHSDIDVQFFGNIKSDIDSLMSNSNYDILFQNDRTQACMGFFVCKSNGNTKNLFEQVYSNLHHFSDDQHATNHYLNIEKIKWGYLPERYFSVGVKNGLWEGRTDIYIPPDILVHHSNFTVGIENKINLIKLVREKTVSKI